MLLGVDIVGGLGIVGLGEELTEPNEAPPPPPLASNLVDDIFAICAAAVIPANAAYTGPNTVPTIGTAEPELNAANTA